MRTKLAPNGNSINTPEISVAGSGTADTALSETSLNSTRPPVGLP
jgi:hypothetical protein